MPSNWMDDLVNLLKPEDPANVASAFSGVRGSVPIYAALYSKDASGPEELAFEARNNAMSQAQRDAQYAALQKKQGLAAIPDEALRRAVAARMSQEEQYPPALATRRADYAPQPRHEMRPYQKGGSVRKTLAEMAQELMSKGVKTADTPDLARRSLFGLKAQPKLDLPLARMDDIQKDLAKAPAITEKSVTIDPGQGAAKSTIKSLTETPMSRRAVMQTAAGQVLRHTIPGMNDALPTPDILGEIGKIVDVAKPTVAAPAFTNPIAIIMHMRKNGASEEEIAKALGVPNPGSIAPAAKPSHLPKPQEEINASKDFMFRDPEARAILEKISDGDIMKFAQLSMDKPNAMPYDWQLKRWLENGELDERMRAWLATKGEHTFMPKDFAQPVDQGRAVRDRAAFQTMYDDVVNPSNYLRGTTPTLKTPSRAFQEITGLGTDTDAPLISMRNELRQIRAADPEQYNAIKNAARDVSMDSAETARAMGLPARKVEKVLKGEISTDDLPNWYKFHRDFE